MSILLASNISDDEMVNEFLKHFLAINTISVTLYPEVWKCKGPGGKGLCTGCEICWRGLFFPNEFTYLIGDGRIRMHFRGQDEMEVIYSLLFTQGRERGTLETQGIWKRTWRHRGDK